MQKIAFLLLVCMSFTLFGQTTLTHSTCEVIKTTNHSCDTGAALWARDFTLSEFNVGPDEDFLINSVEFALSYTSSPVYFNVRIYIIDDDFPASFDQAVLLGGKEGTLFNDYWSFNPPRLVNVNFDTLVVVPAGTKKILVEVNKGRALWGSGLAHIAGTAIDTGISWLKDCATGYKDYIDADTKGFYGEINNFYITATGIKRSTAKPFTLNISNNCSDFFKGFKLNNIEDIASVKWDFGDPASGASNNSTEINPKHDFSQDGDYKITVIITSKSGEIYTLEETIAVREPPKIYPLPNLSACEDNLNSGISSTFDTGLLEQEILKGRTNLVITYLDGKNNALPSPLPNPLKNNIKEKETITVRLSYPDEPCCYSETTFSLIVDQLPELSAVTDLSVCDEDHDGFALFDLAQLRSEVLKKQSYLELDFYHQDGTPVTISTLASTENKIINKEIIKIVAYNPNTGCSAETTFQIIVQPQPDAHESDVIYGCDDNNDGISEFFYISEIVPVVIGEQTGMITTYYDANGNLLPSPLPSPYTNKTPFEEEIRMRVTNPFSGCFDETILHLKTSANPKINTPAPLFSCDMGNGFGVFDIKYLDKKIIGNQTGLKITYFDSKGDPLPNPLPDIYENTVPWSETLTARIENIHNPACYTETYVKLNVNPEPELIMKTDYVICNAEPALSLQAPAGFDAYQWRFNNKIIFTTPCAQLIQEGAYTLTVMQLKNGIACEKTVHLYLHRSEPPKISSVDFDQWGNNYIKINATGDGDFEYSIDGNYFQDSNYFSEVGGGIYTVYVRDKEGCGSDSQELTLIDYPRFFTPNQDGYNDYWQVKGIAAYKNAKIMIFNRYGKLLKQLNPNTKGWSGNFNGKPMPSDDYWFFVKLAEGSTFKGHFTLKR